MEANPGNRFGSTFQPYRYVYSSRDGPLIFQPDLPIPLIPIYFGESAWLQQAEHSELVHINDGNRYWSDVRATWKSAPTRPILNLNNYEFNEDVNFDATQAINRETFVESMVQFIRQNSIPLENLEGATGYFRAKLQLKVYYRIVKNYEADEEARQFEIHMYSHFLRYLLNDDYESYENAARWNYHAPYLRWQNSSNEWLASELQNTIESMMNDPNSPFGEQYVSVAPAEITQIDLFILAERMSVGCMTKCNHPIVTARTSISAMQLEVEIVDLPSRNENCLLAVIRHGMGELFKEEASHSSKNQIGWYNKIRGAIGISNNVKIPIEKCELLSEILQVTIELYVDQQNPTLLCVYSPDSPKCVIRILIENEHALWIRPKQKEECNLCKMSFAKKGLTAHKKLCEKRHNSVCMKCEQCGYMVYIPKTADIQTEKDVTDLVFNQAHTCKQNVMSFYQRMIINYRKKKEGKQVEETLVRPLFVPEDNSVIPDDVAPNVVEEFVPIEAPRMDQRDEVSSQTKKQEVNFEFDIC